jgi:photosystem II stability/assembly factor-like uncharacterized protein
MKRKLFTTLTIVILSFTVIAQQGWYPQTSGTTSLLMDVYFTDVQNGWAVGIANTILHTSDGGDNWISQDPIPSVNYYSVYFTDSLTGCAVGSTVGGAGKIRRTTDGGDNWVEITAPSLYSLWEIYFVDDNNGWIAGGREYGFNIDPIRTIHYTNNGGMSWTTQMSVYDSLPLHGIHFYDENIGCVVGEHGNIFWTNDGGTNWIQKNSGIVNHLWGVYVLNETTAWAVGVVGTIIFTTDSGENWTVYNSGFSHGFGEIIFTDDVHGWIVGGDADQSTILYTSDAGSTWVEQTSGADHPLMGVSFADTYNGWAVGNIGTILHTDDGGGISQEIQLSLGYQFASGRIEPENPDMLIVLQEILNDDLDFVRNSEGNMLRKIGPNWVNGIGDWVCTEGYLFKMNADASFHISGNTLDPLSPISLIAGYQFISYLPEISIDAIIAFDNILNDNLDFIRNSNGETLRKIGPIWVNGIGNANPGEAYLIKMFEEDVLIYTFPYE